MKTARLTTMATLVAIIAAGWSAADAQQRGDEFRWTGALSAGQTVWVRNIKGNINIEAGSGSQVDVQAVKSWRDSDPGMVRIEVVESADGITICALWEADEAECGAEGEYEHDDIEDNDVGVDFTIQVPRSARVDASSVSGNVQVAGTAAPVDAATVSGDVTVNANAERVRATTVSGSVEISGDIRRVRGTAVSGDIDIVGGLFERGEFETVSGSIRFDGAMSSDGEFDFETLSGTIELTLPDDVNAEFDVETFSGSIMNDFGPDGERTSRFGPGHELEFTAGSGGAQVNIESFSGGVRLRRRG